MAKNLRARELVRAPKKIERSEKEKKSSAHAKEGFAEVMLREALSAAFGGEVPVSDMDALMASLKGPWVKDGLSDEEAEAKGRAQELALEAMEAPGAAQARRLAKRALKLDADCVDALALLTTLDAPTQRACVEGLQKAVAAGERSLGARFLRENEGSFWLLLDTRPMMRALEALGEEMTESGLIMDAIAVWERILRLNPNDNQGVRYRLLGLYLAVNDLREAAGLLARYAEDTAASFAWGRVLERLLAKDETGAKAAFKEAMATNSFVAALLTGRERAPELLPEMYAPGSLEEAAICLYELTPAWSRHKEEVFWVFDRCVEMGLAPVPSEGDLKKMRVAGGRLQ